VILVTRRPHNALISVVIPAFNEQECIPELVRRLSRVFLDEDEYRWECIVIENGSTDESWPILQTVHEQDRRFKVIRLSRNFGMDGGLTAGLGYAEGDACILMTADLQDPPEMIPQFLREWERGYDNVFALITRRRGAGVVRRINSWAFYRVARYLTDINLPLDASDFRLLDRRAYEAVRDLNERNRFIRGLAAWVGFSTVAVPMERPPRFGGKSKATTRRVIDLAVRGIFAHSYAPLRFVTVFGIASAISASVLFIALAAVWLVRGVPFSGFGTLVSLALLLFSVLALMIGLVSEYVGLIYEEVKQRPNYIVSDECR